MKYNQFAERESNMINKLKAIIKLIISCKRYGMTRGAAVLLKYYQIRIIRQRKEFMEQILNGRR